MKKLLLPILSSALLAKVSLAAVIPVSEDTYSGANHLIARMSGKASSVVIGGAGAGFLRFDAADFTGLLSPDQVKSAHVVVYVKSVQTPADLKIHAITSDWNESATGNAAAPAYDAAAIATLPADTLLAGQYLTVDITAQVKLWLANPAGDFGIALEGAGIRNLQLGSKEGASSGHAAWLEIETGAVVSPDEIASGIDATKVGDGSVSNAELSYLHGVLSPLQQQFTTINNNLTLITADSAGKVSKAGDTMTGSLTVKGDVKVGAQGDFFAASGEENLRMIRGTLTLSSDKGFYTITSGKGFTISQPVANEEITINFDRPFSDVPSVIGSIGEAPDLNTVTVWASRKVTTQSVTMTNGLTYAGATISFIIVGPR